MLSAKTIALAFLLLPSAAAQSPTSRMVSAANEFLATLDDQQRKNVLFAYDDEEQRKRWSNLPITIVQRKGISFKEMTPAQQSSAMALLSAALSPSGLRKVQQIMEGDEFLKNNESGGRATPPPAQGDPNQPAPGGRGRGGRGPGGAMFGKDLYYFSILGTPSEKSPWMLQFGGHHLALNLTVDAGRGILTPTLTGAQPAFFVSGGRIVRPLENESNKGLALLSLLDASQRKQAVLNYRVADLVLGPGQDGKTIQPEGLKGSAMNEKQRDMMLDLIYEWAAIVAPEAVSGRMAQLKAELDDTWFAWSGPTTPSTGNNITAYYRIQGPHLVIEYAPQQMGGDPALHVHTMYRDPTNDYGRKPAAK